MLKLVVIIQSKVANTHKKIIIDRTSTHRVCKGPSHHFEYKQWINKPNLKIRRPT